MIEKLLKPYISQNAKLVLEAMEKIGSDHEKMADYYLEKEYWQMYDDAIHSEGIISRWVLAGAFTRLRDQQTRKAKQARAAKTAAQILMGADFKPQQEKAAALGGSPVAPYPTAGIQQAAGLAGLGCAQQRQYTDLFNGAHYIQHTWTSSGHK